MRTQLFATVLVLSLLSGVAEAVSDLPWTSDFEESNFSEWSGGATSGLQIVDSGCPQGRYCASAPLTQGTHSGNYADHMFGDYFSVRNDKVEEVYLQLYSKFDSGYVWPNDSQKIAILNLTDGVTNGRRYQVYVYADRNGEYRVDYSYWEVWRFFGLPQNVGSPVSVRFNQWDKLKLYVRLNTPGSSDGVVKLWVNGDLKVSYSNVNIREGTAFGMNKLNLSSYATDASGSNGTQWYDDWVLSATDPEAGSPPSPPTNLTVR